MNVKYNLVVDFARPSKTNTIIISENDTNSRVCHFTLLNNKEPMPMSDVTSVTIRAIKKDGSTIFDGDNVEILKDDNGDPLNELLFTIPAEMTNKAGNVTATITLMSTASEQLTSFEFYLLVRNALYNEDDVIPESDMTGFRDLLRKCEEQLRRMQEITLNDTLPNPYPIEIRIEDDDYVYDGTDTVEIELKDMAYINEFTEVVDAVDASASARALLSELKAEGYAYGTQNGIPVDQTSEYYRNNSKYYSEHTFQTLADTVARAFSITERYAKGDMFTFEDKLYQVKVNGARGVMPPNDNYYRETTVALAMPKRTSDLENNSHIDTGIYVPGTIINYNTQPGDEFTYISDIEKDRYGHIVGMTITESMFPLAKEGGLQAIAADWDDSKIYTVGSYVIYNGFLWKCKVQNNGQIPAENAYWTKTYATSEIKSVDVEPVLDKGTLIANVDNGTSVQSLYSPDATNTSTESPLTESANGNIKALKLFGNSYKSGSEIIIPSGDVTSNNKNLCADILNGYIDVNSSKIVSGSNTIAVFYAKANTTYTVSATSINRSIIARFTDKPQINSVGTIVLNQAGTTTYTITSDGWYAWYINNTITDNVMVEKGTSATEYIPHASSTVHTDRPMLSVNDIKNELIVNADGSGKFVKRVEAVTFNEISGHIGYSNNYFYISGLLKKVGNTNILASVYDVVDVVSTNDLLNGQMKGHVANTNVYFKDDRATTRDDILAFIGNEKFIYELATPTETELSIEEVNALLSLQTFENETYVDADGCEFEIKYYLNNNIGNAISEVFQYANNGKSLVAQAIIGKGGSATTSDTFGQLASAIENLPSGTIGNPLNCHLLPLDRLAFYDPAAKTTDTNRVCAFYKRRSLDGQQKIHVIIIKKSDRAIEIVKFGVIKSDYTSQSLGVNINVGSTYQVWGSGGNTGNYPERDELVLGIGTGEYQNLEDYLNDFEFYVWESD